jgi:hypothetical protein
MLGTCPSFGLVCHLGEGPFDCHHPNITTMWTHRHEMWTCEHE